MTRHIIWIFALLHFENILGGNGAKNNELNCGACQALIHEMEHKISQVDPKKMVEYGGFRIGPDGKTKQGKIPYGYSEEFLNDNLDDICHLLNGYGALTDENDHTIFIPATKDGKVVETKNLVVSHELSKTLVFAKVPYARSEEHIGELLESVCNDVSNDYVISETKSGKKTLKRMVTHDGQMSTDIDFQKLMAQSQNAGDKPPDTDSKDSKFKCETIIEMYEDEIINALSKARKDAALHICANISEYCDESDIEEQNNEELSQEDNDDEDNEEATEDKDEL